MRPLLFGTESTNQLRIACDMLRAYSIPRSQRARLSHQDTFKSPAVLAQAQTPDLPSGGWLHKFRQSLLPVAFIGALVLSPLILLVGGNPIADAAIKALRAAEQQRVDNYWRDEFGRRTAGFYDRDRHIGDYYDEILLDGHGTRVKARWMGQWRPELRRDQLVMGDEYGYRGGHFVWWTLPNGSLGWIDP